MEEFTDEDHLAQDQRLDQRPAIVEMANLVLGEHQPPISVNEPKKKKRKSETRRYCSISWTKRSLSPSFFVAPGDMAVSSQPTASSGRREAR